MEQALDIIPPSSERSGRASRRALYRFAKRVFDIVFSAVAIVLGSWLYALIVLAIKIDDPSGPVLFKQLRVGKDGRTFRMWKFRSMRVGAEAEAATLMQYNEKDGPVFKMHDDPRVTRVGRFLRAHSLDELPQFFNVLMGQMSVVGPRPGLPSECSSYNYYQASPELQAGHHQLLAGAARSRHHQLRRVDASRRALPAHPLLPHGPENHLPDRLCRASGTGLLGEPLENSHGWTEACAVA